MKWIKISESLPPLSYIESDDDWEPYERHSILVYAPWPEDCCCVAHLTKEQNEDSCSYGELYWEMNIPGEGGSLEEVDFDVFTYWAELPKPPEKVISYEIYGPPSV